MNRLVGLVILFLLSFQAFSGKVVLTKTDMRTEQPRFNALQLFKKIPQAKNWVAPITDAKQPRRVIALRVEFREDDDARTTGNGRMDYVGNGEDPILDIVGGDTLLNPYYDGPHTQRYFEMLLECLKNYYLVNSYGHCQISYRVFPDGDSAAYQLPHTMLYYGNPDEMELGLCTLLRDAVIAAQEQDTTTEFRQWLVTSHDLLIFHAGSCWQTDIMWDSPYDIASATIPRGALLYYLGTDSFLPLNFYSGGVVVPEMARQDGVMFGLEGQLVHEYAHSLGHFDLYDVTGRSMGVGAWDVMGYGGWLGDPLLPAGRIPSLHGAFFKYLLDWVDPVVVEHDTTVTLDAVEIDTSGFRELDDKTLMVKIPINSNEYYLVENRQEYAYSETLYADMEMGVIVYVDGGQWDYFLPGSGLLIWHIDEQVIDENWATNTVNADASRKGVDLEEADGVQDFDGWVQGSSYEIYGNEYDAFFSPHNDSFAPRTTPSTADNDGGFTGMYVVDVSGSGNSMSARIQRGGDEQFKPRDDFPLSLGDTSGFGTNSVAVWDEDGQSRIVVAGRGGELYVVGNDVTTLSTGDTILSSPLVCGDSVIVVTRDGWWYTWTRDSTTVFDLGEGPFYSSPAAGDLDGDGRIEFVVGSDDMWLYFVDNGEVVTKKFLGDVIRTSPAIADLNGDGADEVIVSVGDSRLFVFSGSGDVVPGFPVVTEVLGPLCASPVVGDLDADGELELVALSMDGRVYCYDVFGDPVSYWPAVIGQPGSPSPALGDIDRDGYLEVVVLAGGNLYAFNHNGTICTGFPVEIKKVPLYQSPWVSDVIIGGWPADTIVPCSSPVLVDIEGDGYLEILFGSGTNLCAYDYLGNELEGFPLGCGGAVSATPSILVRGDTLRLFAASDEGMLYSWEVTGNRDTRAVWPMFRGDLLHSGSYLGTSPFPPTPAAVLLKDVYNYPNPVHGARTTLRYYLAADATVRVRIFDVAGEVVGEYEGRTTPNEYNEMLLNLDGLATGLYIYKIEAKGSTRSEEVIGKLAIVR